MNSRKVLSLCVVMIFGSGTGFSQTKRGWYQSSGGEMIMSMNIFTDGNQDITVIRWAPVFNIQSMLNRDLTQSFGIYTGINFRNVGFIADDPSSTGVRMKFRTYNAAVPLGVKLGRLDGGFVYLGTDLEYAFNYKEKRFVDGEKVDKRVGWLSNRVNNFQPALHVGFQFISGTNIKFKYYLDTFFDDAHSDYASNYQRFDGNIFYLSLNSFLFENTDFVFTDDN